MRGADGLTESMFTVLKLDYFVPKEFFELETFR